MFLIVCRISVLFVFLFPREAEMQKPNITSAPPTLVTVVEGESVTLEWTYNSGGSAFRQAEFVTQGVPFIVDKFRTDRIAVGPAYVGRITANITETNASITFIAADSADSRTYDFIVHNEVRETATESVEIKVQIPPSFNSPSPDQVVTEGAAAVITLPCNVAGVPTPNITWTKVFANGSDSDVLFTGQPYVFSNNRNNAGTYRCKADNGIGRAINQTIDVTINFKAENIQLTVNDSNVCEGDVISISCSADGNPAVHTYQLFENDTLISNSSSPIVWTKTASTGGVFVYRCEANNTVGTANRTRTITVNVPPAILQLSNITVTEGENRTLTCNVTGSPEPAVSWTAIQSGSHTEGNILQLTNISRNDDGEYKCDASNLCGNDNKSTYVIVHFKPEIIQLTVNDTNVCQGDVFSIICSADGNPVVHTYHLFENDTLVSSSSSPIVWSKTASTGGVFVYRCEANNTVGTANRTRTITVNVPSSITAPILDKNVTEGENLTLTCQASGTPSPTVSWIKVSSGQRTNGNVLQLTNISRSQAGDYRCEATNVCSNASEAVTIDVQYKPEYVQFTSNATGDKACLNNTVKFNCSADANPPVLSYHLFGNDTALEISNSGMWSKPLSSSGLFIYKCVANNNIGSESSTSVSITVNVPSSIKQIPDKNTTEGDNLTLTCQAFGTPPPTVSWIKVSSSQRTNENVLQLTNISRNEAGDYRCEASNECGNSSELVNIDVQYKPENVQLKTNVTADRACQNDIVKFNCSADANPPVMSYQLFRNSTAIETSSLGMWSKSLSNSGLLIYKCIANNSIGSASSTSTSITVNVPSSITAPIPDKNITEGENLTLPCQASGTPSPTVSWIKVSSGQRTDGNVLQLTNISRSQAGDYRCEASNECGNSSEPVTIDVQYKPDNVQLTTNVTADKACQNDIVMFNCSADANPPVMAYQLFRNDTVLQTSSTGMWSKSLLSSGLLIYKCIANNTIGSASSISVPITVNVPSSITAPIPDKNLTEGENLNLTCQASGTPSPTVSWIKVSSGQRTDGNVLQLTNISRSQAGDYRCEASNECGNSSEPVTIDVQYKPENVQLTTNATGDKACKNDIVKFSCSANANPPAIAYQLFRNDTALETNSTGMWSEQMTSRLYVYKCVANNTIGTASSTSVSITVNVPSSITPIPDENITEGNNLNLTCQASGTPSPAVSWIIVSSGQRTNGSVLQLTNISRNEAGDYRCEASNECGDSSEPVTVTVQYPPVITDISGSQRLNVGATVTLNCTADGNPAPSITWTKVSDGSVVTMPLTITGKQDEGTYRCTADNSVGSVTSDVSIEVHFPASIVPLEETKRVTKGDSITLYCNVSGQPPPSVSWTRIDSGLKHNNKTWVISNIGESDLGEYRCDASNEYGNATDTTDVLFAGGRCEKLCTGPKTCQRIGSGPFHSCRCVSGKKGTNCEQTEAKKTVIVARIKIDKEFKDAYRDLADPATKEFVKYIEGNCTEEYKAGGQGLKFDRCLVTKLSPGSVIADLELKFKEGVHESEIRELTDKITEDGRLGQLKVDSVSVGPTQQPPEDEEKCNAFFEGKDCKKAKPALIALCAVAGVAVLALLVAIIACSLHKKKRGGQSFSSGEYGQPRHEPEGHGGTGERNGVNSLNGAGRAEENHYDNTGYEHERQPATPMVTFTNPSQTPGITVNDSSVTKKAQPGEGTYADLGEFHQKAAATPTGPVKKPPAYEETPYAEITQFLKGPVETKEETQEEESVELKKQDDWNNSSEVNDSNADNLYPALDHTDNSKDQPNEEFIVSI